MKHFRIAAFTLAAVSLSSLTVAAPLFSDNFNTAASSANYAVVSSDITSSFPTWAFNYSTMGIPSAPNSGDGSTLGVKLDANNSAAPNVAESITLHTAASYTGDYTVLFDAWINVNGPFPGGGSGSTNFLTAGVGGDGATNNRGGITAPPTGIGGWLAVNGDNGNGVDYRWYKNTTIQLDTTGQYAATTDAQGDAPRDGDNAYYASLGGIQDIENFPVQGANQPGGIAQQNGDTFPGSFGMAWHRVVLKVDPDGGTGGAASMKWFVDGLHIGTLDAGANGAYASSGRVTLGYSDPTNNASDNRPLSFALIDNLVITPEPGTLILFVLGCAALVGRRRS
jgi:hypothetical protein